MITLQERRYCVRNASRDPVAQLVEQRTFNPCAPNDIERNQRHTNAFGDTRRHAESPESHPNIAPAASFLRLGFVRQDGAA